MRQLKEFVQEEVAVIRGLTSHRGGYHGLNLSVDPNWFVAFRMKQAGLESSIYLHWLRGPRRPLLHYLERYPELSSSLYDYSGPERRSAFGPPDLTWRPDWWDDYRNQMGLRSEQPLVATVALLPGTLETEEVPSFAEVGIRVHVEERPPARLSANPRRQFRPVIGGVSCGSGQQLPGTLGGIVRDDHGRTYALTCAHVAESGPVDQPAQRDGGSPNRVGEVVLCSPLEANPAGSICNHRRSDTVFNSLDVALIAVDDGIVGHREVLDLGWIDGVTADRDVAPFMPVDFSGRSSGHVDLETAALNVEYAFKGPDGSSYCFEDTLELRQPPGGFWSRLSGSRRSLRPGDSGGWACRSGQAGLEWCAMAIGEDGQRGYAIYATDVLKWLKSEGYNLSASR